MICRRKCVISWTVVPALALCLTTNLASGAIWNAANDYDAGWASANNPNDAWSYGWSSDLSSSLHLYTRNHINSNFPDFRIWDDPAHQASLTPNVYKNVGPDYPLGTHTIEVPAGALILHGGGPSGNDYSHVTWTAPTAGTFALDVRFTGRQSPAGNYQTFVYVLSGGAILFQDFLSFRGDTATYSTSLSLFAGDNIDFAVGITGTGLHGETTQLEATITESAVPEPGALWIWSVGVLGLIIGGRSRHRERAMD